MRITGGNAARRILKVPKGLDVARRPDLVKQAVFNSLGARVEMRTCWSCSPFGRVEPGMFERGAASVMCIEKSHRHAEFIRSTPRRQGSERFWETRTHDVFPVMSQLGGQWRQFDLILADPPYGEKNVNPADVNSRSNCLTIQSAKLIAPGGRLVLGHTKRDTLESCRPGRKSKCQARRHRDAFLELRRRILFSHQLGKCRRNEWCK